MNSGNRVDGIGEKFGYVMLGILFASCTVWIPTVGWIVALAWLFIGIAFAVDNEKLSGMAGLVFLGLLLWFIPAIGGFLALALVILGTWATYWPTKRATSQCSVDQATFTELPGLKPDDSRDEATPVASRYSTAGLRNPVPTADAVGVVTVSSSPVYVECRVQHSTEASVVACGFHNRPENTPQWLREKRFAATWNRRPPAADSPADKLPLSLAKQPTSSD